MTLTLILGIAALSAAVSGGTVHALHKRADRDAASQAQAQANVVEATANVVGATGAATQGALEAATAPALTDAGTRLEVATWDATTLAVHAAVQPGASRATVALAAYLGCVSGSQGKGEGSAAYGCGKRGEALDTAIAAMPSGEAAVPLTGAL